MFSTDWNLPLLNTHARRILQELEQASVLQFLTVPGVDVPLPASAHLATMRQRMILCSGYPEHAGAWSYTLLHQSLTQPEVLPRTSMAPYFRGVHESPVGLDRKSVV